MSSSDGMKIISIVGARPNFMKVAPLHRAFKQNHTIHSKIIHTGQHFDRAMSTIFFEELELPEPDYSTYLSRDTHQTYSKKQGSFKHSDKRFGQYNEIPPGEYFLVPGLAGQSYKIYVIDLLLQLNKSNI